MYLFKDKSTVYSAPLDAGLKINSNQGKQLSTSYSVTYDYTQLTKTAYILT